MVDGEWPYAYLGAMTAGVILFDVTDTDQLVPLSRYIPDVDFPRDDPNSSSIPNARGLAIRNDALYLAYDSNGLRIIDYTNKTDPKEIRRTLNSALNKQQAYNNVLLDEDLAYVGVDYCGMEIYNISDPWKLDMIGWFNPWASESPNNIWFNSPGHINQLAHHDADQLFFLSAVAVNLWQ